MKIDYKKELESASRSMIMIHDPKLLIKLIIRMIIQRLKVRHAAMIISDPTANAYVLSISRGETGFRIPAGFTRFTNDSPIIKLFTNPELKKIVDGKNAVVAGELTRMIWRESVFSSTQEQSVKEFLQKFDAQLKTLNTEVVVPAYYRDELLALLLLGNKNDLSSYEVEELDFFAALASDAAMAIRNAQLFTRMKEEVERNKRLFIQTVIVLGSAIEAKDSYTHGHTERVTALALAIARQMVKNGTADFEEPFFENMYIGGLLHDIGKIAVPEYILNKPGRLTPEEYDIMKQHALRGAEIVKPLNLPLDTLYCIKYHHEAFDGSGYPEGLAGKAIPIAAAIMAVADTYDAMTTDRPYRKGLDKSIAIEEIRKCSGAQFNPLPVKAFIELTRANRV